MQHKHAWIFFWYHEGCPPCKVRKLRYGFRLNPIGYMHERDKVMYDLRFTSYERVYILNRCKPVEIDHEVK